MRNLHRALILTALCLSASACDYLGLTAPGPESLNGLWIRTSEVPGSSEQWQLAVDGPRITGSGTWTGEACCDGTLAVTGTIVDDSIHVDVTYTPRGATQVSHEHFDGALESKTILRAALRYDDGTVAAVRFQKVIPI